MGACDGGTIELRTTLDGVDISDLHGFFVGWPTHPDAATHYRMMENAAAVALAVDTSDGRVVGFAHAISDGVLSAYIPLLEVLPDWQGQGLGHALIESLCGQLDHLYMIDVVCDAELEPFYGPMGFVRLSGMAKRNYENQSGHIASGSNAAESDGG